jgi:hypothetical protein
VGLGIGLGTRTDTRARPEPNPLSPEWTILPLLGCGTHDPTIAGSENLSASPVSAPVRALEWAGSGAGPSPPLSEAARLEYIMPNTTRGREPGLVSISYRGHMIWHKNDAVGPAEVARPTRRHCLRVKSNPAASPRTMPALRTKSPPLLRSGWRRIVCWGKRYSAGRGTGATSQDERGPLC